MKLLTLSDRLWGLAMTTTVYGAMVPALLVLGAGTGRVPVRPDALKTFDVAFPQPEAESAPPHRPRAAPPAKRAFEPRPSDRPLPAPEGGAPEAVVAEVPASPAASSPMVAVPAAPLREQAPATADNAILREYAARLWAHIAARRPPGIRLEGTTVIAFTVTRSGALEDALIAVPSGDPMLDRLAIRTVRRAAPLPLPPDGLADDRRRFTIPFSFS
ncbi:MAG: energy transducer TonB [Sphingomonas sp.]|uniref:energy transducer TonB family protein n=1 Tax=Sphingomonas sp. TaxID=28214 RepID=UPI0022736946|nr:energy transducer TonB [Sphingomonas sp.]MCX8474779.1 energy transducer TonB [Sphingomonas sp.]